jgi:hypothetical protein
MVVTTRRRKFHANDFEDEALSKAMDLMNGRDLLFLVKGDRDSAVKFHKIQCVSYKVGNDYCLCFVEDEEKEEDSGEISIMVSKIQDIIVNDWNWDEDEFTCHIVIKFVTGNELHIHDAA